jgi:hypothetical protein
MEHRGTQNGPKETKIKPGGVKMNPGSGGGQLIEPKMVEIRPLVNDYKSLYKTNKGIPGTTRSCRSGDSLGTNATWLSFKIQEISEKSRRCPRKTVIPKELTENALRNCKKTLTFRAYKSKRPPEMYQKTYFAPTNGPGPAQEHQNGRTNGPGPAQEHQSVRTNGPGPAQEH